MRRNTADISNFIRLLRSYMDNKELLKKYDRLKEILSACGSVAVAFSGGVDSAFLLYAAKDALGDKAFAVTSDSALCPGRERGEAAEFCRDNGIRHIILKTDPLEFEGFAQNPVNRCYICKKNLFELIKRTARENGAEYVAEGSNKDDDSDFRPGRRAVEELGILTPLRDSDLTKSEIRALSHIFGLPTADKPSFACLATRFPYGDTITRENLEKADRAEQILFDLGFDQYRVRIHSQSARIELPPADFERFMSEKTRLTVYEKFRELGFDYVLLDIAGYRMGSMNLS